MSYCSPSETRYSSFRIILFNIEKKKYSSKTYLNTLQFYRNYVSNFMFGTHHQPEKE